MLTSNQKNPTWADSMLATGVYRPPYLFAKLHRAAVAYGVAECANGLLLGHNGTALIAAMARAHASVGASALTILGE